MLFVGSADCAPRMISLEDIHEPMNVQHQQILLEANKADHEIDMIAMGSWGSCTQRREPLCPDTIAGGYPSCDCYASLPGEYWWYDSIQEECILCSENVCDESYDCFVYEMSLNGEPMYFTCSCGNP